MFPALRAAFREWRQNNEPVSLGLKNFSFGTTTVPSAEWLMRNGYSQIASILGGAPSWSGESVTIPSALSHSVVWACQFIISNCIGSIPSYVMQRTSPDAKRYATEHPMYEAMEWEINDDSTAQEFKEQLTGHCLLSGNGYGKIIRRSGTGVAIGMQQLLPNQVLPDREKTGAKRQVYVVKGDMGAADKTYVVEPDKPHEIFHLRGLGWDSTRGYDVIAMGRQSIGTAIAGERNVARFWANGGRVPYNLKLNKAFADDSAFDRFRQDWERVYSEPGKAPILEPWLDYQQTGENMRDSQGVEWRQAQVSEICRWFNVSPPLVHDLSRATFSNIEHLFLQFKTLTLAFWLERWEQAFRRDVLTPSEKAKGYFLRSNADALLRGDVPSRFAAYASALQNGHMSVDEVREDNDFDPLPEGRGSGYHVQTNMGSLAAGGQVEPPAQPRSASDDQQSEESEDGNE